MKIPGLIDLQVNGYKGVDFSSPKLTESDFAAACRALISAGTTGFLPTIITSSEQTYRRNLPILARVLQKDEFKGRLLGLHLEGPFISPNEGARGAHNQAWIRKPDIEFTKRLIEWADGQVKLFTLAAELEGSDEITDYLNKHGITVSLGHQMAHVGDINKLATAGARGVTHLGNAVPSMIARHDNPIWAALASDELYAMIITDGHHLPAEIIKTILRTKGVQHCIVVSDGSPHAGFPPGSYVSLGKEVLLEGSGRLYDPKTGYLVGSSATMLECMNYLASLQLLELDDMIAVAFYNPLSLIGVDPASLWSKSAIFFNDQKQRFVLAT